jgi:hypothetical protein
MAWVRRQFLQLAGASAAACVGAVRSAIAALPTGRPSGFRIDYDSFKHCEGREFLVATQTREPVTLRLDNAARAPTVAGYPDRDRANAGCFSLVFVSEQPVDLVEGIHAFRTPDGAEFAALISPLSPDGRRFQVVFNRL